MSGLRINGKKITAILILLSVVLGLFACKDRGLNKMLKKIDTNISNEKYKDALELIEKAKEEAENNQGLLRMEGIALMGMGDYEAAIQSFDVALGLNKKKKLGLIEKDIIYYKAVAFSRLGKHEPAYTTLDALANEKGEKDSLLLRGILALKLGRKQDAVSAFDRAIESDKKNLQLYIDVFNAFANNNYLQSGKDYLSSGIRMAQKSGDKLSLGKLFYYNEEYEMAIKTLENESKLPMARVYMAKAMYRKGDVKSAYEIADQAIKNDEQNSEYYNIVGLYHISNQEYEKAMNSFLDGLRLKDIQNDCELRYNEAVVYEFIGDFGTAKQKMEALIQDYPELESAKREFLFLKTR